MNHTTARHYLISKIAQILYDTVECQVEPRASVDWHTAEGLVDKHFGWMLGRMTGIPVEGVDELEVKFGRVIWENARGLRRCLPRPPYGEVTFS